MRRAWRTLRVAGALCLAALLLAGCAGPPAAGTGGAGPAQPGPASPSMLLARALESIEAAQRLLRERGRALGALSVTDDARFVAFYEKARRDCTEILERFPAAPEAPEAAFTLGLIEDYPHLNRFDRAVEAYRLTETRYPGTATATRAAARRRLLEEYVGGGRSHVAP